jgi:hypothetical protein
MIRPSMLSALVLAVATPAMAHTSKASGDSALAPAFKGTIVSTYPDGRKGKLWLSSNGTYKAAGRRNDKSNGHWTLKGDNVCLKQSSPLPIPFAFCTPKPTSTSWKAKAVGGEPITVHVEPGGRPA